jgi:cell division protein FtsW
LTTIGLIAIYAASSLKGAQQFNDEFFFFKKQLAVAILGFGAIFVIRKLPLAWIQHATLPYLAFVIFLLTLIFVPGAYSRINGAQRWLNVPIIGGQPSELTKLALVLFLARNLARVRNNVSDLKRGILPNFAVFAVLAVLLLKQKDLGTPVLLFLTTFCMLLVAGVSRGFVMSAIGLFIAGVGGAVLMEPFRMQRILSFLDPWSTVKGSGFQIIQSFVAFQNGGLFGVGLGESRQKLFFLPEAHTDFILSVIGEELGLVGVLLILLLFFLLTGIGVKIALAQTEPYRKFLAFGLTCVITLQAAINMGVTMGLLPTKGIPLPFISSGTSSLIASLMITAVLARLAKDTSMREAARDPFAQQAAHTG